MLLPAPPVYNNQKILEAEAERMRLRSRRSYPIAFRTPSSRPVSVHTAAPRKTWDDVPDPGSA